MNPPVCSKESVLPMRAAVCSTTLEVVILGEKYSS